MKEYYSCFPILCTFSLAPISIETDSLSHKPGWAGYFMDLVYFEEEKSFNSCQIKSKFFRCFVELSQF